LLARAAASAVFVKTKPLARSIADVITDSSLASLTMCVRNKLASWQATGHPLVGPTHADAEVLSPLE
jgi:hypothetical protein